MKKADFPEGKSLNPLHSSFILTRSDLPSSAGNPLKLSQLYTKAASSFDCGELQEQAQLVAKYESRIKGLESGYERSKEQYEKSLKNMYKQKMVLLNIISHNHALVDEFRNKLKLDNSTFREVETKYNIIASALFHNQLCSQCILSISNTELHSKGPDKDKESPRTPEQLRTDNSGRTRKLAAAKQYSWMHVPNSESPATAKLRAEVSRLRANLEEQQQQKAKRIQEKNRQIQQLKAQLARPSVALFSLLPPFVLPNEDKAVEPSEKPNGKLKEKLKQLQNELGLAVISRDKCEALLRDSNERIAVMQLEKLNAKYRSRFF